MLGVICLHLDLDSVCALNYKPVMKHPGGVSTCYSSNNNNNSSSSWNNNGAKRETTQHMLLVISCLPRSRNAVAVLNTQTHGHNRHSTHCDQLLDTSGPMSSRSMCEMHETDSINTAKSAIGLCRWIGLTACRQLDKQTFGLKLSAFLKHFWRLRPQAVYLFCHRLTIETCTVPL